MEKVLPAGSIKYLPENNLFADYVEDGAAGTIQQLTAERDRYKTALEKILARQHALQVVGCRDPLTYDIAIKDLTKEEGE